MKRFRIFVRAAALGLLTACASSSNNGNAQPAVAFKVEIATAITAGAPATVTITALGASGNTATNYRGTASVTADDSGAILPGPVAFGNDAQGKTTTSITFKGSGVHVVTVTDSNSATGFVRVTVGPSAAAACVFLDLPLSVPPGALAAARVTLADAFGNVATSYVGTMRVTSTDDHAQLPGNQTWLTADSGTHPIGLPFLTAGNQTVTVTD